jgi:peroxiredoxin
MPKVKLDALAPDFVLTDVTEQPVRLADFRGKKNVVLVFNRGFL